MTGVDLRSNLVQAFVENTMSSDPSVVLTPDHNNVAHNSEISAVNNIKLLQKRVAPADVPEAFFGKQLSTVNGKIPSVNGAKSVR